MLNHTKQKLDHQGLEEQSFISQQINIITDTWATYNLKFNSLSNILKPCIKNYGQMNSLVGSNLKK